jgi:hypothetical protein
VPKLIAPPADQGNGFGGGSDGDILRAMLKLLGGSVIALLGIGIWLLSVDEVLQGFGVLVLLLAALGAVLFAVEFGRRRR